MSDEKLLEINFEVVEENLNNLDIELQSLVSMIESFEDDINNLSLYDGWKGSDKEMFIDILRNSYLVYLKKVYDKLLNFYDVLSNKKDEYGDIEDNLSDVF